MFFFWWVYNLRMDSHESSNPSENLGTRAPKLTGALAVITQHQEKLLNFLYLFCGFGVGDWLSYAAKYFRCPWYSANGACISGATWAVLLKVVGLALFFAVVRLSGLHAPKVAAVFVVMILVAAGLIPDLTPYAAANFTVVVIFLGSWLIFRSVRKLR